MTTNSTLEPPGAQRIAVERPMVALIAEDPDASGPAGGAALAIPRFSLLPVAGAAGLPRRGARRAPSSPSRPPSATASASSAGCASALGDAPLIVVATPARDHDVRLILAAGRPGPRRRGGRRAPRSSPPLRAVLAGQLCIPRDASRHAVPRRALAPREGDPRAASSRARRTARSRTRSSSPRAPSRATSPRRSPSSASARGPRRRPSSRRLAA